MQRVTYELMYDQVSAIFRALTGNELTIPKGQGSMPAGGTQTSEIEHHFAELESCARLLPTVAEHVPPFAFSPPMDVIEGEKELVVELAVPGVTREDVQVERTGEVLVISGTRPGQKAANGRAFRHAEIPRGPFRRVVLLAHEITGEPNVTVEDGIIRVRLANVSMGNVAKA